MVKRILLWCILLVYASFHLDAQVSLPPGQPLIKHFKAGDDYPAHTQVWDIQQDQRGIMYFCTSGDIVIFDGIEWRKLQLGHSKMVRSCDVDNNGIVYFGGVGEIGYLYYDSLGKEHISLDLKMKIPQKYRDFNDIWKLFCTSHGTYFESVKNIYHLKNDTIKVIEKPSVTLLNKVGDEIYRNGYNHGFACLHDGIQYQLPQTEGLAREDMHRVIFLPYKKNDLLIVTHSGIYVYKRSLLLEDGKPCFDKSINQSLIKEIKSPLVDYFRNNYSFNAVRLHDNLYAVSTYEGGIVLMDTLARMVNILSIHNGLPTNTTFAVIKDKQGDLWAGTQKGVFLIHTNSPISIYSANQGIKEYVLSLKKYQNKLYAGCFDAIYVLEPNNLLEQPFNHFVKCDGSKRPGWSFLEYKSYLLATNNRIAQIKDKKLITIQSDYEYSTYSFLTHPSFPHYIFICAVNGLYAIKTKCNTHPIPSKANIDIIDVIKFDSISTTVRKGIVDTKGDLWLTTEAQGLIKVEFGSDIREYKAIHLKRDYGIQISDRPYLEIVNGKKYVNTDSGIYELVEYFKGGKRQFSLKGNDLFEKYISKSAVSKFKYDSAGNFWIQAVDNFTLLKKEGDSYYIDSTSFNIIPSVSDVYITDHSKTAWIFGEKGIYKYDNRSKFNFKKKYATLIRNVVINNDSLIFFGNYPGHIKKNGVYVNVDFQQEEEDIPVLEYRNNTIKFQYTSTFYVNDESTKFSYILEGFDENWSDWTSETKSGYTNLREGNYTFKVKALNIYDFESDIAEFKFVVHPPWYRTWWAYVLFVLIILLLIWAIIKLYTKRLKKQNIRLENIVALRTSEIVNQKEEIETQNQKIQFQYKNLVLMNEKLQKLSVVASETDNAIIIMNAKGDFEWINEGFERLYGFTLEQLKNEIGSNILQASTYEDIQVIFNECKNKKHSVNYISLMKTRSGKEIWAQTTLTPIINDNNEIQNIIAIDSDISKIIEAEKHIEFQNRKIKKQRDIALLQKKEITDSIEYAKHLQNAIYPSRRTMDKLLQEYFILNKPKSIVSGDFYWIAEKNDKIIITVSDCTGHGVPGALMSMLGISFLNKIVKENDITESDNILNMLRSNVIGSLHQSDADNTANDGMEIALAVIDRKNHTLQYSGAMNPLLIVRKEDESYKIITLKHDVMPIAVSKITDISYTSQYISLKNNDTIYFYTDGYIDQFGGDNGTRFNNAQFKKLLLSIQEHSMASQKQLLEKELLKWKNDYQQIDDILVMGIRYKSDES